MTRYGVWIGNWIYCTLITSNSSNYNATVNLHILQFTTAHANSSQFIFTSGCLVTYTNNALFCSCCYWLATVSQLTHCSKCPHCLAIPTAKPWRHLPHIMCCHGNVFIEPLPCSRPSITVCLQCQCLATAAYFSHPVTIFYDSSILSTSCKHVKLYIVLFQNWPVLTMAIQGWNILVF
jgi:hypothetical protein